MGGEQAQVLNGDELIRLIRARVEYLDVPIAQLEDAMNLTGGYLGKILGVAEVRRIGFGTIWKILEELGLRMVIVAHLDRDATLDEMAARTRPRMRKGPPRGKLRKTLSPAIIHAAAQCYGAMGRGERKTFRSEKAKKAQRRAAGRASGRARRAKHRAALCRVKPTQQYIGGPSASNSN